jgi:hypothetical protein
MSITSSPRAAASRPQAFEVTVPINGHDGTPVHDYDLHALEAGEFDAFAATTCNLPTADSEDLRAANLDAAPELQGGFDGGSGYRPR